MSTPRVDDELAISALLHRYARAVDAKDWELYRSVFTEDADIDYPGVVSGSRDEVADWMATNFDAGVPMSMHYITNIEILEYDGDSATVRAMFYNPMQLVGMADLSHCGGYYHHELVRTGEGWKSRRLREDNVWFTNRPAAVQTP